ncbi:PASTA domain-containing protein [Streptomyces sp. NPDC127091]|uniref:PASTA domain-containing protein n=1 Tax=Streptomyces sp. NPDC127091 TaxID=3347134 RepID=UPI00365F98E6
MRVPRLVGLMAVDARESARTHDLLLDAPDRPDFRRTVVDHVVRQYPQPGVEVPRGSLVHVWFDFGEGDGGGIRREREEPREPAAPCAAVLSRP